MKITDKFLSIPPYLSVSWREVAFVRAKGDDLVITLKNGDTSVIPSLTPEEKELVFQCHSRFLEQEALLMRPPFAQGHLMPISFKIGTPEGTVTAFEHNPEQKDSPPIPKEILDKIVDSTQGIPGVELKDLPMGEPNCNCFFCQIMNAIHGKSPFLEEVEDEEIIDDKELTFREWDVSQTSENLYSVVNALDANEKYTVFLGHPVGCTCGKDKCEHIEAVLKS